MKIAILDDWNHFYDDQPGLSQLRELGDVTIWHDKASNDEALIERLRGVSIVGANRERTRFPAALLESLPDVELISQSGSAGRHIDIDAATRLGIAVASGGGAANGSAAVAELGLGLLLSLTRNIPRNDRRVREGDWAAPVSDVLFGKTLGVIGLGKIGLHMARACQALGMSTVAWGPTLTAERASAGNVEYVAFDDLFPRADVLFISPILSDLTRGIVGAAQLAAMKPTSYLINISRGPIVQEAALIQVLREKRIRGAGLDVFDEEPLPADHPLTTLDNVVLTPHIGWVTQAHFTAFANGVITNAVNYLQGNPSGLVNPEALNVKRGSRS
ncbi:MAG: D-2-hydroxyacid dehydrogenase family protein [Chloroflexota bacterium]